MRRCMGCGAGIVFHPTPNGKAMPVNAETDPNGNIYIDDQGLARVVDLLTPADAERYMPHWATCPNSKDFKS